MLIDNENGMNKEEAADFVVELVDSIEATLETREPIDLTHAVLALAMALGQAINRAPDADMREALRQNAHGALDRYCAYLETLEYPNIH